jgi:chromosome partitioning protein
VEARGLTTYDLLRGDSGLDSVIVATAVPRLFLVPASADLAGIELEMGQEERREFLLANMIRGWVGAFDEVLIDCPPSLNLLTINALVGAERVLVPLQREFYALEGLAQLMRTVERVQQGLNPRLALEGVLLTMYDQRNNLSDLVAADVRRHFGAKVYTTMIPRNVRISEAPSHGMPVLLYDPRCAGSQAYIQLAGEMMRRGTGAEAAA